MAKKRGNGEGSVRQVRNGRWEVRWWDRDGQRRSRVAKSRPEAARVLREEIKRREESLPSVSRRLTVAAFLAEYLDVRRHEVRPSTWTRSEEYVRIHVVPVLGQVQLVSLSPGHLQRLYSRQLDAGYAPATVQHLHRLVHHALKRAVRWGLVARNVAELVDPPRVPRREMRILDTEQVRRFLQALVGDRLEALYILAITTGARQGELFALRWCDVDLENQRIAIRGTLTRGPGGPVVTETKTGRGRQVLLTGSSVTALQQHRVRQLEERLRAGSEWTDGDFVFTNEVGGPLHTSNVTTRSFRPALKRAGLPTIRFHDLRHSTASLLMAQGVHPKVVSERLGHSQISITLDLYSHVTPTMQAVAVTAIEEALR